MKRGKPALIAAGAFLGLIAVFVVWVNVVAARRWDETLRRTKEIEQVFDGPFERPPLRAAGASGNAGDDYAAGVAALGRSGFRDERTLQDLLRGKPVPDEAALRAALEPLRKAVDLAREGVRRPYHRWTATTVRPRLLVEVGIALARFDARDGRPEAFLLLADLARIAMDQEWIAPWSTTNAVLKELQDALESRLDVPAGLSRDLETLERGGPRPGRYVLEFRNDVVRRAERHGSFGLAVGFGGFGWRHAGSSRLYFAGAMQDVEAWARSLEELRDRPWPDVEPLFWGAEAEAASSGNGFLIEAAKVFRLEAEAWSLRARLRVARAGAAFRAEGRRLELDDPFGGKLHWDDAGVRSRGPTDDPKDDIILRLKP